MLLQLDIDVFLFYSLLFFQCYGQFNQTSGPLIVISNNYIYFKVGFLASDQTEIDVINEAIQDILDDTAIDSRLKFNVTSHIVQCGNGRAVAEVAEMYYNARVDALIGPSCPDDLDCAAKLAGVWQMPIISYTSSVSDISNSEKFPSLVSVSTTTGNSLNDALVAIFNDFIWPRTVLIYNIEDTEVVNRVTYLLKEFTKYQVDVNAIQLLNNVTEDVFLSRVNLNDIKSSTRAIIIMMGERLASNEPVLRLLRNNGVTCQEYFIILPWLIPLPGELFPWINENNTVDPEILKVYADAFVLDADRKRTNITDRFTRRIGELYGIMYNIAYKYTPLYDAFKLYVLGVNQSLAENGVSMATNGSNVYANMINIKFEGSSGVVNINSYGDRIPNYSIYIVNSTTKDLTQLADIVTKKVCNDSDNGVDQSPDCYKPEVQTYTDTYELWQTISNKLEEPPCGYNGSKCDNSKWYIISGAVSLILVSGVVISLIRRYEKQRNLAQMPWRVPIERVQIIEHSNDRAISTKSNTDTASSTTEYLQGTKGVYMNTVVKIGRYKQLKNINIDHVESHLLLSVKQLVHDNIVPFLGLCYNNPSNELLVMWKYCHRGSLNRYLQNTEMHMDIHFKTAFIRDIMNGIDYLHNAPIGYHGKLNTNNCVIDANFIVKLNPVELDDVLQEWKGNGSITPYTSDARESMPQFNNLRGSTLELEGLTEEALFYAPEFLRKAPPNRIKLARMGKSEQLRIKNQYRAADIYSLAMCIYEILFRQHPFAEIMNLPTHAIINALRNPNREQCRPKIPKILNRDHHPVMLNLMQACWNEDPLIRPPIKRIKKIFSSVYKIKGSLVDSIIAIMDQHANSLEKQVKERTRLLEEAQLRADRLLAQMIPKDIARDLKLGKPVVPRAFTSASVLFTDIVSFTTICSRSTPMEIVNFLNDLFTGYDAIISQLEAYKVETIGDAYLVCSGVPVENGTDHVKVIATIALKMKMYLNDYKLPHVPDHKMEARWGLHSGPLAAGVVGLIAPRYCLFGDTVNVASRMESTGKPGKIQASSEFQSLITQRDDPFIMEKRGTIHVKGKGEVVTYWLVDHRQPPVS